MTIDASSGSTGAPIQGAEGKGGAAGDAPAGETADGGEAAPPTGSSSPPPRKMKRKGKEMLRGGTTPKKDPDRKRTVFILLGLALFSIVYFLPTPPEAVSPRAQTQVECPRT